MSAREWKPGDVAMVNDCTRPERPWEMATCTAPRTPERETTWRLHKNGGEVWGSVSEARPLVVIDPEDREQVERLAHTFSNQRDWYADTVRQRSDAMQAALREFTNPPKVEVFRHYVGSKDGGLQTALCGKVWRRNAEANVTVVGDCPTCLDVVAEGWSA